MQAPKQKRWSGGGGSEEEASEGVEVVENAELRTPQKSQQALPQASPSSSGKKVQFGLLRFLGTPEQKAKAQPALVEAPPKPYQRKRKAQYQVDAEAEISALQDELAELQLARAQSSQEAQDIARFRSNKRPSREALQDSPAQGSSNRKKPGTQKARTELSAKLKLRYCQEMEEAKSQFASLEELWDAQAKKYGLRKDQLRHIFSQHQKYQQLQKQKPLSGLRQRQKSFRTRAQGAGRKVPYPHIIKSMKAWLSLERCFGHRIGKADLSAEYLSRLQLEANKLTKTSEASDISALKRQDLLLEAQKMESKKQAVLSKKNHLKKVQNQLIAWLDAKYVSAELVSTISSAETQTRCMLTWQEFDHSLWLATLASAETLAETQRVADAKAFVEGRAQLVLGFSDQIPLWAKASGRRAIFAEEELHASEHKADFSEVRKAISDLMHEDGSASFALGPLAPVARKLSFGETSEKQLVEAQPGDQDSGPPGARPAAGSEQ